MHFLNDYGLFLLKLFSLVIALLATLAGILALLSKDKSKLNNKLIIRPLNKQLEAYAKTTLSAIEDKQGLKTFKKKSKREKSAEPRLFVLNFNGDIRASCVNALREEITAILLVASPNDQVLLRLESAGGLVNAYGLAASQLSRFKEARIKLTVAIDKMAASGGYLMAAVADHILAAPFAIIGSIGVVAQLPNFYHLLKKKHIDFEQITAGEYKRTLSLFGENTAKGREKMQQEVDETHHIFKTHIQHYRPQVDINGVATGEHWLAQRAQQLALVDELNTSDDYLLKASKTHQLYEVEYKIKKALSQRIFSSASRLWGSLR